jgi:NDP-sugar pyrophosphorylase family protein
MRKIFCQLGGFKFNKTDIMIKQLFSFTKKIFGFFANDKVVPIIMKGSNVSEDSSIGNYTYIGYNCNVTKSSIGRYCSIANNVTNGSGEHIIDEISTSSLFYEMLIQY